MLLSLCAYALEQLADAAYGLTGVVAMGAFTISRKSRDVTCQCVGIVIVAVLLAR